MNAAPAHTQNRTRRRREPAGPRAVGGPMGSKAQPHRVFLSTLDTFPPSVVSFFFSLPPTRVCSSRYLSRRAFHPIDRQFLCVCVCVCASCYFLARRVILVHHQQSEDNGLYTTTTTFHRINYQFDFSRQLILGCVCLSFLIQRFKENKRKTKKKSGCPFPVQFF